MPMPGGAGAGQHDPRLGQRRAQAPAAPARTPADDDRGRALDVVVERRHAVAVAVEDPQRVVPA